MRPTPGIIAATLLLLSSCNPPPPEASPSPATSPSTARPMPGGPSVVLISADTLRADRVSAYGYQQNTTPQLDKLAAQGLVVERVYAPAGWTLPSHMTLFTSQLPTTHGVTGHLAGLGGYDRPARIYSVSLGKAVPTLAELMWQAGYTTVAHTEAGWVSGKFGFSRGFETYVDDSRVHLGETCSRTLAFLEEPHQRPYFLFMHTYATHIPYDMPEEALTAFGDPERAGLLPWGQRPEGEVLKKFMKALFPPTPDDQAALNDIYDSSVRYLDGCVGRIVEALAGQDVVLVFLSDHGEELFEHGMYGHGETLYDEVLRVPLVLWAPGRLSPERRPGPAGLVDVMPTVLELAGLPVPDGLEGVSLLAPVAPGSPRVYVAEGHTKDGVAMQAIVKDGFKLIRYASGVRPHELYDLSGDPGEHQSLMASHPELAQTLAAELERVMESAEARAVLPEEAPSVLDEKERERLRALGYLN